MQSINNLAIILQVCFHGAHERFANDANFEKIPTFGEVFLRICRENGAVNHSCAVCTPGGGGGGGGITYICMHIEYVPRERPPFSALNFRSGAYHFHKLPKNPEHRHLTFFGGFCRSRDHHFQNFFNFNPFIASHSRLSPNAKRSAAPRVSGRSGDTHFHAQNGSSSFRRFAFSRSKRIKLVPEPRIFTLKTAQARSGAPTFHARQGARSGALANCSLCRGTCLPKFGVSTPPPPPGFVRSSHNVWANVVCSVVELWPVHIHEEHATKMRTTPRPCDLFRPEWECGVRKTSPNVRESVGFGSCVARE